MANAQHTHKTCQEKGAPDRKSKKEKNFQKDQMLQSKKPEFCKSGLKESEGEIEREREREMDFISQNEELLRK